MLTLPGRASARERPRPSHFDDPFDARVRTREAHVRRLREGQAAEEAPTRSHGDDRACRGDHVPDRARGYGARARGRAIEAGLTRNPPHGRSALAVIVSIRHECSQIGRSRTGRSRPTPGRVGVSRSPSPVPGLQLEIARAHSGSATLPPRLRAGQARAAERPREPVPLSQFRSDLGLNPGRNKSRDQVRREEPATSLSSWRPPMSGGCKYTRFSDRKGKRRVAL